jgi:hypothetical protein
MTFYIKKKEFHEKMYTHSVQPLDWEYGSSPCDSRGAIGPHVPTRSGGPKDVEGYPSSWESSVLSTASAYDLY